MAHDPTAIVFDDAQPKPKGPQVEVLSFADASQTAPLSISQPDASGSVAKLPEVLDFGPEVARAPSQAPTPVLQPVQFGSDSARSNIPKHVDEPAVLFGGEAVSTLTKSALAIAKTRFPEMVARDEERFLVKLRRLQPLQAGQIANWCDEHLKTQATLTNDIAARARRLSLINAGAAIESAIRAANTVPSMLSSLIGHSHGADEQSGRIAGVKQQLAQVLEECEQDIPKAEESEQKLAAGLAVLSSLYEAAMPIADKVIESALTGRRNTIASGLTLAKMNSPKLQMMRQECVSFMSQADQVLNVTIPAWRLANAHNK